MRDKTRNLWVMNVSTTHQCIPRLEGGLSFARYDPPAGGGTRDHVYGWKIRNSCTFTTSLMTKNTREYSHTRSAGTQPTGVMKNP
jgi:hypothetical protein